jgi:hypothetical protein
MNLALIALAAAPVLFFGMLAFLEIGRRVGIARLESDRDGLAKGVGAAEGAVFGLLGLIIAFTFSGAASRFEDRRHLIVEEVNAIGTAYLRIDLLPGEAQPEMRELIRHYLDMRSATYLNATDEAATKAKLDETLVLQAEIWKKALAASQTPKALSQAGLLLLPALNAMFDIATIRTLATRNHPPLVIFLLLAGLSLIGSTLVGYSMSGNKGRSWLHTVAFAAIMSLVFYVIVDLEFPRLGLIRVDIADQALVDLRQSMH